MKTIKMNDNSTNQISQMSDDSGPNRRKLSGIQYGFIILGALVIFVLVILVVIRFFIDFTSFELSKCSTTKQCDTNQTCIDGTCRIKPGHVCSSASQCATTQCENPKLLVNGKVETIKSLKVCLNNTESYLGDLTQPPDSFLSEYPQGYTSFGCTGDLIVSDFYCLIPENGSCSAETCASGLLCIDSVCKKSDPLERCSVERSTCRKGLRCATNKIGSNTGTNVDEGICQPDGILNGQIGAFCIANSNCDQGLQCQDVNGSKVCVPVGNQGSFGQPCGSCLKNLDCAQQIPYSSNIRSCYYKDYFVEQLGTGTWTGGTGSWEICSSSEQCPPWYTCQSSRCLTDNTTRVPNYNGSVGAPSPLLTLYLLDDLQLQSRILFDKSQKQIDTTNFNLSPVKAELAETNAHFVWGYLEDKGPSAQPVQFQPVIIVTDLFLNNINIIKQGSWPYSTDTFGFRVYESSTFNLEYRGAHIFGNSTLLYYSGFNQSLELFTQLRVIEVTEKQQIINTNLEQANFVNFERITDIPGLKFAHVSNNMNLTYYSEEDSSSFFLITSEPFNVINSTKFYKVNKSIPDIKQVECLVATTGKYVFLYLIDNSGSNDLYFLSATLSGTNLTVKNDFKIRSGVQNFSGLVTQQFYDLRLLVPNMTSGNSDLLSVKIDLTTEKIRLVTYLPLLIENTPDTNPKTILSNNILLTGNNLN